MPLVMDFVPDNSKVYELIARHEQASRQSEALSDLIDIARRFPVDSFERNQIMATVVSLAEAGPHPISWSL
jgi:hypothetical protein